VKLSDNVIHAEMLSKELVNIMRIVDGPVMVEPVDYDVFHLRLSLRKFDSSSPLAQVGDASIWTWTDGREGRFCFHLAFARSMTLYIEKIDFWLSDDVYTSCIALVGPRHLGGPENDSTAISVRSRW
jgi:hypothetical protein